MVPLKVSVVSATTVGEKRKLRQQLLQYHINPLRLRASLSSVSPSLFILRVSPKARALATNQCTMVHVMPEGRRDAEVAEVAEP